MNETLLLDTCAIIWLGNGKALEPAAMSAISKVSVVLVSPISVWEIGLLSQMRSTRRNALVFLPDVRTWLNRIMANPSIKQAPVSQDIALDAATLPGDFHRDPADRLIVATARLSAAAIVTRDRKILDYAETGNVGALAC